MKFVDGLLVAHLARYPAMQFSDVYKLLYQAAMGNGHLVETGDARAMLLAELADLGPGGAELLFDPISPDGRLGRVHLRAFRQAGLAVDDLVAAFVGSAQSWPPSPDKLVRYCGCLGDLAAAGTLPFTVSEVEDRLREAAARNYPAIRHSEAYRAAYRPAYRIVDRTLCAGWPPPGS